MYKRVVYYYQLWTRAAEDCEAVYQGPRIQDHAPEVSYHSSVVDGLPSLRTCEYHVSSLQQLGMIQQAAAVNIA